MADKKNLQDEELENLELDLEEISDVAGGQNPIVHQTGDIPEKVKPNA